MSGSKEKINIIKSLYEHLKTKKKYNTLKNAYDTGCKTLVERTNERDALKTANEKLKKSFKEQVDKLLDENIELQKQIKKLRRKIRNKKKEEE